MTKMLLVSCKLLPILLILSIYGLPRECLADNCGPVTCGYINKTSCSKSCIGGKAVCECVPCGFLCENEQCYCISDNPDLSLIKNQKVESFAVRIKTRSTQKGGNDTQVWFDVGFKAWELDLPDHDDFEPGSLDTYTLQLPPGDFIVDDIIEVRLEKKGIGHFTGAPDSIGGAVDKIKPNIWEPESISLVINGKDYKYALPEGVKLKQDNPAWRVFLKDLSDEERFVYGLRTEINDGSGHAGEIISRFTTEFKKMGISGWQTGPVPGDPNLEAEVTGILRHEPSPGTDGYVSLDLELNQVVIKGRTFDINGKNGVRHPRYIRIEYLHKNDKRYEQWKIGDRFKVKGPVKWDTDKGGFYEIHPTTPSSITTAS